MKILIADHDMETRTELAHLLASRNHEVLCASTVQEALDHLEQNPCLSLALVAWEANYQRSSCLVRALRSNTNLSYLYIILLWQKRHYNALLDGLEAGADAFLIKPVNPIELTAKLKVAQRVFQLEKTLEDKLEKEKRSHEQLKRDLASAGEIQRSFMPRESPFIPGILTAWSYQFCSEVAGDTMNVFHLDENHMGMYILDVSGHGVAAALLSVSLSRVLTHVPEPGGILKQSLKQAPYYRIISPQEVAVELNRRYPVMAQSRQYFTFLYGILNLKTYNFQFIRAGHHGPIVYNGDTLKQYEQELNLPIGLFPDASYVQQEIQLQPGDKLLMYTDGLDEAVNHGDEAFGKARIHQFLRENGRQSIDQNIKGLITELNQFTDHAPLEDDLTMIGFSISPDQSF